MAAHSLKVLIVDDENEACQNLENILHEYIDPSIEILGWAHSTAEAQDEITRLKPDAVFMDIEMPGENAFTYLERVPPVSFEIIFVTAYDEYAIRAFRLNAIDYIQKPINIADLEKAVIKLKEKIRYRDVVKSNPNAFGELSKQIGNKTVQNRITLKDKDQVDIVDFKDILFIEAQGSYCNVFFISGNVEKNRMMSHPIAEYEEMLPADVFYRVHKSYLVNCSHIKKMKKTDNHEVVIRDHHHIPVGRRRYAALMQFITDNPSGNA